MIPIMLLAGLLFQGPDPAKVCDIQLELGAVNSVAFDSKGKYLAVGCRGGRVVVIDVGSNSIKADFSHPKKSEIMKVAFMDGDEDLLLAGQGQLLSVWSLTQKKEIWSFDVAHSPYCGSFSKDRSRFISGSGDGFCSIWNFKDRKLEVAFECEQSITSVVFGPGERWAALGCIGDKAIQIWDIQSRKKIKSLEGHEKHHNTLALSVDGKTLASGSTDKTIRFWDAKSFAAVKTLIGHKGAIAALAFSPDGKLLASFS